MVKLRTANEQNTKATQTSRVFKPRAANRGRGLRSHQISQLVGCGIHCGRKVTVAIHSNWYFAGDLSERKPGNSARRGQERGHRVCAIEHGLRRVACDA